jgi:putative zinc finger protein
MDCIHARVLILLQDRDAGELDAESRAGLDHHLEQCADCLAWSNQESRVDAALGEAIRAVPVPPQLPSRILHRLERERRPRRWPWVAAAAACLLLGLSAGGYFWFDEKPVLSMQGFEELVSLETEIATARDVEERFAEMGMPIAAPTAQFNFDYYNGSVVAPVRGYRIPRLEFVAPQDGPGPANVAHVYVVDTERYDADDLLKAVGTPVVTSKHHIEVLRPLEDGARRFLFIVVYTGNSLAAFVPKSGPI